MAADETPAPTQTDEATDTDTDNDQQPRHRTFESMDLDPEIKRALDEMGYDEPMEVQGAVYDSVVDGRDMMVQARTGTGKTAAFGIPIAQMLSADDSGVQALILAPTRELALQVSMELGNILRHKNVRVVPVYGGAPMGKQIDALKAGAQVVAGTPGRVLDHIGRKTLKTGGVKLLVLDECDEMLSMGFQEEIEKIIATLPDKEHRQTLLFSATIPADIERIARRHMTDPETLQLSSDDDISVDQIDHSYYVVSGMARTRDLLKVIEVETPSSAIIFCNTREDTNTVAAFLRKHGYDAEAISSDLSQSDRERVMKRSRDKNLRFLVATDVAARGIDIADLSHVINYAFPESPEVYVHRTGRTGRAGNEGRAVSLVGPREIGSFYYLKLLYKIRPRERELPSEAELSTLREGKRYAEVLERVPDEASEEYRSLARRLWQSPEGERVVGTLLQQLLEGPRQPARERARKRDDEPRREARSRDKDDDKPKRKRDDDRPRRKRDDDKPRREAKSRSEDEGAPRKKRRRRRERPQDDDKPKRSSRIETKPGQEFWEAWADDKNENGDDAPKDDAEQAKDEPADDTTRLYVNIGRREDIDADGLRALLAEGMDEKDVEQFGKIHVRNTHCYIRVPEDLVDRVIAACAGKRVGDRDVVVERARK